MTKNKTLGDIWHEQSEENLKRDCVAMVAAAFAVMLLLTLFGMAITAKAEAVTVVETPTFRYYHDWSEPKNPEGAVRIMQEIQEKEAAKQAEQEAAEAAAAEEAYYEEYYPDYSGSSSYYDSSDGFKSQGVRGGVDSSTETWYSSNSAYHYRTSEWSVDDEGYYRDSDGYYVVASNDYGQGEVVTTSKGEAKVYDDGTYSGNIDMYVAW